MLSTLDELANGLEGPQTGCWGPELRTETIFLVAKGDISTGPRFRSPWPFPRGLCPWVHTAAPKSSFRAFTCWQRAGGPEGQLAQALMAWGAGLSLEAWPGALRRTGVHFLSLCAQESRPRLPVEAERAGRLRVGGPEVLVAVHLPLGGDPARTPGSVRPGTGWHGGFGQVGRAGVRSRPTDPGPAEGQLGQALVGRLGSLQSVGSEQGGWPESQGRGAEGPAGGSGRWPHWRSLRLPAGARAPVAPTAPASR